MKSGHNTRQDRPIVNATDDTSDALLRARTLAQPVCTAAASPAANSGRGTMNARRSISGSWCSVAVLFVFVAVMLAASIAPALAGVATFTCDCGDICVNETGWWRDGGVFNASSTSIQHAIYNATAGNTIYVYNGTYTENVNVNKTLTLTGEGADVVNVNATLTSDHVFDVTADYVNISGFNLTGATDDSKSGIHLSSRQNCNISDNILSNNKDGIRLESSSNNTLTNNTASNNTGDGIYLSSSSNNTLTNNNASNNTVYGIRLSSSSNNTIYNNYFNNTNNAYDDGNNTWNTTPTTGTNIIGGSWLGGNYWSDYAGADTNGDGLGDTLTPYNSSSKITYGGDYHPLVTPSSATPTSSGGGDGTYPPGWFETPTPTVTATKAPAATTTATDAPPGDKVTPTPTKAKPAAAKATAPAAEGTTAGDAKDGAPGFTAVFVIAGMLAVAYAMMRRRE